MAAADPEQLDRLLQDYLERCRRGEQPQLDEYCHAHPELADEINELFPAVAAMEQIKSDRQSAHEQAVLTAPAIERLGDYRLIREIGRGGMGIVFEAEQETLRRRVAVKILPRASLLKGHALERFEREARTAAKLHHTNIVPVFGVGRYEDYHYLAMQYIDGVGLDAVLRALRDPDIESGPSATSAGVDLLALGQQLAHEDRTPPVTSTDDTRTRVQQLADLGDLSHPSAPPPPVSVSTRMILGPTYYKSAARIILQVAEALEYAHAQGTLHRDVKPGNLLLDGQGIVWITDFGLAKAMDEESVTHSGDVVGTLRYMSPEQLSGFSDARSDLYSLGLTLYELVTLRPAFADTEQSQIRKPLSRQSPVRPRRLNPHIPVDLDTIIQKAVSTEPEHRYQSGGALAQDLQLFLDDRPILARRITALERAWRWSRRNVALSTLIASTAGLLLAVAVIASLGYWNAVEAQRQISAALRAEEQQRARSDATTNLVVDALDSMFDEFSPTRLGASTEVTLDEGEPTELLIPSPRRVSPEAARMLERMLSVYEELSTLEGDDVGVRRKVADAQRRLGNIHHHMGTYQQARTQYERSLQSYRALAADSPNDAFLSVRIATLENELGVTWLALGEPAELKAAFERALLTLELLPAELAETPAARFERARTLYLFSKIFPAEPPRPPRRGGDPGRPDRPRGPRSPEHREALAGVQQSIEILEPLIAERPEIPAYRHLLAQCYIAYRSPPRPVGPPERGRRPPEDTVGKAVAILEQLVRELPAVPEYQLDLATALMERRLGDRRGGLDSLEQPSRLERAEQLIDGLLELQPDAPDYILARVALHERVAGIRERLRRPEFAERELRLAGEQLADLVRRYPGLSQYAIKLSALEGDRARLLFDTGRTETGVELLMNSVQRLREVPDDPGAAHERLLSRQLSVLAEHVKDREQARALRDEARALRGR